MNMCSFLFVLLASTHTQVLALEPTKVRAELCQATQTQPEWAIDAPKTTEPNTPRFDVILSSTGNVTSSPSHKIWAIEGSLGLPDHPLGVFKFTGNGSACGSQVAYVKDGVLGQILLTFPPCPWRQAEAAPLNITMHVDVWTVIPVIPPLISVGLEMVLTVTDVAEETQTAESELLCLKLDLSQPPESGAEKSQDVCLMDNPSKASPSSYPPTSPAVQLPVVTVDLDKPTHTRWDHVVVPRKKDMHNLIESFTDHILKKNGTARALIEMVLNGVGVAEMKRFPQEYREEIEGIALSTGIGVGSLWILNMMYEIIGSCTSFVVQDDAGAIWHGRNLDFGLFMGTDPVTHSWSLTELLRKVLINVQFTRGGKVLYNTTTYAGFVGLTTGTKAGAFSITVDTRYDDTFDAGVIGWILDKNNDCQFLTFQTRSVMEHNETFQDALQSLVSYRPLGPAYIIIGGTQPGEGAVIAKEFNVSHEVHGEPQVNADVWHLNESLSKGSFYVAETNYDRRKAPPSYDDRRYPMENCLDTLGPANMTAANIWKVLSSNPTLNALTTFSTILSAGQGHWEAYMQRCDPGPTCAPF